LNSDKTNQTLREIVACCQNIQQLIEYFGDNPTIFVQTNEYICAVIGQCMFLRDLVRFSLPYQWKQNHQEEVWIRVVRICNMCAHPYKNRLNLFRLWFFVKCDIPVLVAFCQKFLAQEK